MKKFYLLLVVLTLFIQSIPASAHVKWFVDSQKVVEEYHNQTPFFGINSKEVFIWAAVSVLVVLLFSILDTKIRTPKKLLAFGMRNEARIARVAQGVLGFFLVTVSIIWKIVLIPEFTIHDTVTSLLGYLEIFIGIMLIFNILPRIASLVLIGLYITLGFTHGIEPLLENAILLALAIYFIIKNSPYDSWIRRFDKHAVEIVRIGTGVTLISLAFTEKLMYPELSMSFLSVHHWNFMHPLLPWFSDKLFVLSTGFAEMIFGIIFLLGYLTRINTIIIACFFATSVTTMAVVFHKWEVEDLVVYSAAILFLFFGHGKTKFFHFMWPNSKLQHSLLNK